MSDQSTWQSRRRFVKAGAATSVALGLGATANVTAQETSAESGDGGSDGQFRAAIATGETYFSGAVFRVVSPPLQDAPVVDDPEALRNHDARVIEYFNTNEEGYLFVPQDAAIEEGEVYVFDDRLSSPTEDELSVVDLVRVQYRPLTDEDLPFEYDEDEDFEILEDGGGEAAIRPDDFYSSALFEITSGAQGWLPQDVEQSGLFTDYNTVHARYLGTNQRFLLFAQEGAQTDTGQLYVMRDESEIFDPAGNLVAAEFSPVDEDSLTFDDEFLR
ncbi:twin-arginine translocation signal domain-containing protein [Natrinema sp. DC36]|uniref:twin-arginine translocation signal domain-containing protein n=1 Tax=Natrinema sp. DC36 TaxID=2878680 RepID=UPI001CF08221|nr:twin-arginine translocation signal domain-containing protein [Natrinema sp. DC36]